MPPNGRERVIETEVDSAHHGLNHVAFGLDDARLEFGIYEPFPANIPVAIQQPRSLNGEQRLKVAEVLGVVLEEDSVVIDARPDERQALAIGRALRHPVEPAALAAQEVPH